MSELEKINEIASFGQNVDFGRAATDYRKFRAGFPEQFFDRVFADLNLHAGMRSLDIGAGTGTVARGFASRGLHVSAIDPSTALMQQGAEIDSEAGISVEYVEGKAEQLPFAADAFDLVTAGQCWHWFERQLAAREVYRVLKPGGRVLIAHFDWLPLPGNVVEATEEMILKANPSWALAGGSGIYPLWAKDIAAAGFNELETRSFDIAQPYSHEAWCGRIRASAGIKASLNENEVAAFSKDLDAMLRAHFPDDPLSVPHRVWWIAGKKPSQ